MSAAEPTRRRGCLTPGRVALGILGLVVLLIAPVFAMSSVIPATIRDAGSLTVAMPIERLYAALMDDALNPIGGEATNRVRAIEGQGQLPVWDELQDGNTIRVRTLEVRRPDHLVRRIEDPSVPLSSDWTIELTAVEGGTRVDYAVRTTVGPGGWQTVAFRFLAPFGKAHERVEAWIRHAAQDV